MKVENMAAQLLFHHRSLNPGIRFALLPTNLCNTIEKQCGIVAKIPILQEPMRECPDHIAHGRPPVFPFPRKR